jgi:VanZ family protein
LFKFLEKRKILLVYVPLVLYWIILFTATTIPGNQLPDIHLSDKIEHFSAFFVLAILLNLTMIYQRKSLLLFNYAALVTIIICLSYGAIDELHQMFIPGRSADLRDWLADSAGVIIGVLILNFAKNLFNYTIKFE